jgi:hypothetical protein
LLYTDVETAIAKISSKMGTMQVAVSNTCAKTVANGCVLEPKRGYTEAQKEQILSAYHERSSMRGIERTFGVSRPTLVSWLKKERNQPKT